jgi:hypothetical protein
MAANDPEGGASPTTQPIGDAAAVTPSDTVDLTTVCRGLWVGGGGNVELITFPGAHDVTFIGVPSGTLLPVRASRVKAGATTATSILALY